MATRRLANTYTDPLLLRPKTPAEQLGAITAQPVTVASKAGAEAGAPATGLITPRSYSPEVMGLYNSVKATTESAPYTSQDIMQMPEYTALADVSKFNMGQAQAGLDRTFASRNMLRSTPMVQASNSSAAYYTSKLNEQLPALINAAYARKQQQLENQRALLASAMGLEDAAFNRGVTERNAFTTDRAYNRGVLESDRNFDRGVLESDRNFNRGALESDRNFKISEAAVTGTYTPSNVASLLATVVGAKKSWANEGDGTTKAQDEANANAARQALAGLGYTAEMVDSLVGPGVTLEQAEANLGRFAQQTNAGKAASTAQALSDLELKAARLADEIAADPNLGTRAMKQKALEQVNAEIASTRALETQRLREATAKAKTEPSREKFVTDYGIDPGMTTNFKLLEDRLNDVYTGALQGGTYEDFIQWLGPQVQELRSMGVDTTALVETARRIFKVDQPSVKPQQDNTLRRTTE